MKNQLDKSRLGVILQDNYPGLFQKGKRSTSQNIHTPKAGTLLNLKRKQKHNNKVINLDGSLYFFLI